MTRSFMLTLQCDKVGPSRNFGNFSLLVLKGGGIEPPPAHLVRSQIILLELFFLWLIIKSISDLQHLISPVVSYHENESLLAHKIDTLSSQQSLYQILAMFFSILRDESRDVISLRHNVDFEIVQSTKRWKFKNYESPCICSMLWTVLSICSSVDRPEARDGEGGKCDTPIRIEKCKKQRSAVMDFWTVRLKSVVK